MGVYYPLELINTKLSKGFMRYLCGFMTYTLEKSLHTVWIINEVLLEVYSPPKNLPRTSLRVRTVQVILA